jgi:streptogramin lyase
VASSQVPTGGRRWVVPVALALVALAAVAVFVTNRSAETYVPPQGTVARIDAAARFDEPVALAPFPTGLAWGEGRLWATDRQGQIYWLDPASGKAGSRGTAGSPTGVAVGGGAVWITNGFGVGSGPMGGVSELDPVSGSLSPAFETPVGSEAIVWGADRVWVADTNTGEVRIFDPGTRTTDVIVLPAGSGPAPRPVALAYSDAQGGTLWVGDAAQGRVFRISTADPSTIEALTVKTPVTGVAVSDGQVWVTAGDEDAVTVLDSASGSVLTTLDVAAHGCDRPDAIVAVRAAIWVGCSVSRTVVEIDPVTRSMSDALRLDGRPAALTTQGDGSVWVAVGPP